LRELSTYKTQELFYFYKEEENESPAKINDFDGKADQKQRPNANSSINCGKSALPGFDIE
jgi:hypothetical protein